MQFCKIGRFAHAFLKSAQTFTRRVCLFVLTSPLYDCYGGCTVLHVPLKAYVVLYARITIMHATIIGFRKKWCKYDKTVLFVFVCKLRFKNFYVVCTRHDIKIT